jgi:hypothetical protein
VRVSLTTMEEKAINIAFTKKKETKGTWVFEADDSSAVVTTVYVKKSGITLLKNPNSIVLTLRAKKEDGEEDAESPKKQAKGYVQT